jgi:hypothetical protein
MKIRKKKSNERTHIVELIFCGTFTVQHTGEQTMGEAVADTIKEYKAAKARFENEYGIIKLTSMVVNKSPLQIPQGVV